MRFTRWLWRRVDSQGIDRLVMSIGGGCVALAHTLWQLFDVQLVQRLADPPASSGLRSSPVSSETAHQTNLTGGTGVQPSDSPEVEPRTLQHHLSLLMVWLAAAFVCFYWLVS